MLEGLPAWCSNHAHMGELRGYMERWGTVTHSIIATDQRTLILHMARRRHLVEAVKVAQAQLFLTRRKKTPSSAQPPRRGSTAAAKPKAGAGSPPVVSVGVPRPVSGGEGSPTSGTARDVLGLATTMGAKTVDLATTVGGAAAAATANNVSQADSLKEAAKARVQEALLSRRWRRSTARAPVGATFDGGAAADARRAAGRRTGALRVAERASRWVTAPNPHFAPQIPLYRYETCARPTTPSRRSPPRPPHRPGSDRRARPTLTRACPTAVGRLRATTTARRRRGRSGVARALPGPRAHRRRRCEAPLAYGSGWTGGSPCDPPPPPPPVDTGRGPPRAAQREKSTVALPPQAQRRRGTFPRRRRRGRGTRAGRTSPSTTSLARRAPSRRTCSGRRSTPTASGPSGGGAEDQGVIDQHDDHDVHRRCHRGRSSR